MPTLGEKGGGRSPELRGTELEAHTYQLSCASPPQPLEPHPQNLQLCFVLGIQQKGLLLALHSRGLLGDPRQHIGFSNFLKKCKLSCFTYFFFNLESGATMWPLQA